jgi:hypothetical protein
MTPYYRDDWVTIWHGDALEVMHEPAVYCMDRDVMLTDPPYGIAYRSGKSGTLARSIVGDGETVARDRVLEMWGDHPALVFGSIKRPAPAGTRTTLVWDQGDALGMGALDLPWKPSWQLIYVLGSGFTGRRTGGVLRFPPVQSMASNGRTHPHEKPVPLLRHLLTKCPDGVVLDPFMGTGSTLEAAKSLGRRAVGIEIDEAYCERAALRCSQEVLGLPA